MMAYPIALDNFFLYKRASADMCNENESCTILRLCIFCEGGLHMSEDQEDLRPVKWAKTLQSDLLDLCDTW